MMRIDILTLFPGAFVGPLDVSIVKRARESGLFSLAVHDIRESATDAHRSVDDYPYGGGQGMVLRADVLDRAWQAAADAGEGVPFTIYLSPAGRRLDDRLVRELATHERLLLVCGRYEGVDERFIDEHVDLEVSVGDFILTGGELPAMVLVDAVVRHVPGALGDEESPEDESFAQGLLEHAQYTRPPEFHGRRVPDALLGGDHAAIERWKSKQRLERTRTRRPDLLPAVDVAREQVARIPGIGRVRDVAWPEDYPAVRELWLAASETPLGPEDEPAAIARLLARNPGLFLVAEAGKAQPELLGAIVAGWDGRGTTVYHFDVAEAHRGKGVEEALRAELEQRVAALANR